jgi:hypothetical protein
MADPVLATNPVLDYLSKWSPFLLLLLGGLLTQLWNRFRTRMRRFTWKAWHQPIAIAASDPILGTVTVQYNGVPVNNVHLTTVEITNDSSEDQKDVILTLLLPGVGRRIISSTGYIEGIEGIIPFDQGYLNLFQGATPQQLNALTTYVVHKSPVFNRRQKAKFTLLVVLDDVGQPVALASCNHPSVKLEFIPAGPEVDGVPFNLALGMGMVITAAAVLLLRYERHAHPYLNPILGWALGLYCVKVGALVVRGWKGLVRVLG